MSTTLEPPKGRNIYEKKSELSIEKQTGNPEIAGEISKRIGSGDNAKNSIVWTTIKWSFISGSVITLALYIMSFNQVCDLGNLVETIKTTWSIFIPVITLALGYTFGKGK